MRDDLFRVGISTVNEHEQTLVDAIKKTLEMYQDGELAYLWLTSKSELHFRDKLAFYLHRHLNDGHLVGREWKPDKLKRVNTEKWQIDLALINPSGDPDVLVQLKGCYTFDPALENFYFCPEIEEDLEKARRYGIQQTAVYAILLVTHIHGNVPKHYKTIVQDYYDRKNDLAIMRHGCAERVRDYANTKLKELYAGRIVDQGEPVTGKPYGIGVSVTHLLIRESLAAAPNI